MDGQQEKRRAVYRDLNKSYSLSLKDQNCEFTVFSMDSRLISGCVCKNKFAAKVKSATLILQVVNKSVKGLGLKNNTSHVQSSSAVLNLPLSSHSLVREEPDAK